MTISATIVSSVARLILTYLEIIEDLCITANLAACMGWCWRRNTRALVHRGIASILQYKLQDRKDNNFLSEAKGAQNVSRQISG